MVRMLSKNFWVIHLLFIAAAAWLVTHLFILIIKDRLVIYPQPTSIKSPPPIAADKPEPYERYALITERNIFNPGEKGLKLLPLEQKTAAGRSVGEPSEKPKISTEGSYRLVGTIIGPDNHSYAIIQEGGERKQKVYHLREKIGEGEITKIFRDKVLIKRQGEEEILPLTPAKPEKEIRRQPPPQASVPPPAGEVVRRLSANRFLVNREDVTASVGNINQFMTQARFKPYFAMGQPSGYSVSEIIPGSLFEKIGLRNNDVIKKVNGQMINKPEEVFQAYSQLLRDSNIEVEIERGGRTEVFRYEIR